MSSFLTRIEEHPIHAEVSTLSEGLRTIDLGTLDADAAFAISRTKNLLDRVQEHIANTDKALLSVTVLDKTHRHVTRLRKAIDSWRENGEWEPILQLGDSVVAGLANLPSPDFLRLLREDNRVQWEILQSEYADFLQSKESQWNEQVNRREATLSEKLNEWEANFSRSENKRRERFTEERNERSTQFSDWHNESKSAVSNLISEWDASLKAQQNEQRTESESLLQSQSASHTALQKKHMDESDALLKKISEDASNIRAVNASEATTHLTELKRLEAEARNLVGLIGNTAVTGNYQKIADQEKSTANWLRIGALISLAALAGLACWIAYGVSAANFNWEVALFRLLAGVPFLGAAIYCGRESSRHRSNEERNRRLELELASLEPYLYQLSDENAAKVRETLTAKYFGNGSSDAPVADGRPLDVILRDSLKPLEPIADLIKRATK